MSSVCSSTRPVGPSASNRNEYIRVAMSGFACRLWRVRLNRSCSRPASRPKRENPGELSRAADRTFHRNHVAGFVADRGQRRLSARAQVLRSVNAAVAGIAYNHAAPGFARIGTDDRACLAFCYGESRFTAGPRRAIPGFRAPSGESRRQEQAAGQFDCMAKGFFHIGTCCRRPRRSQSENRPAADDEGRLYFMPSFFAR
jgi:hypothetical protein